MLIRFHHHRHFLHLYLHLYSFILLYSACIRHTNIYIHFCIIHWFMFYFIWFWMFWLCEWWFWFFIWLYLDVDVGLVYGVELITFGSMYIWSWDDLYSIGSVLLQLWKFRFPKSSEKLLLKFSLTFCTFVFAFFFLMIKRKRY